MSATARFLSLKASGAGHERLGLGLGPHGQRLVFELLGGLCFLCLGFCGLRVAVCVSVLLSVGCDLCLRLVFVVMLCVLRFVICVCVCVLLPVSVFVFCVLCFVSRGGVLCFVICYF